jgi:NitT/TauT family transport system ATP-binding protein
MSKTLEVRGLNKVHQGPGRSVEALPDLTFAVDAQTRADLEDLMRSVWRRTGVTIVFVTHDIDEAVYLGQRVLVLSSSPTVVQEDLAIDLPDERDQLTTRSDPRFTQLRSHVYAQIQQAKRGGHPGQLTAGR